MIPNFVAAGRQSLLLKNRRLETPALSRSGTKRPVDLSLFLPSSTLPGTFLSFFVKFLPFCVAV